MDRDEIEALEARIEEIEAEIEAAEGADRAELQAHLEAALRKLREANADLGDDEGTGEEDDGFDNVPV
jgi:BMFP domain-containing protein YqiC